MTKSFTIEKDIHFQCRARGRREVRPGIEPPATETSPRVPRIARLMALAIRFNGLIQTGQIRDQAELSHLGQVTRARISQILALIHLAPDIQEDLLFFEGGGRRLDLLLADLRPLCTVADWSAQRRRWRTLLRTRGHSR